MECKHAKRWIVYKCFFPAILISHSQEERIHNKMHVLSFVIFKILIISHLLRLTLHLSHVSCHAMCNCGQNWKLVFYILQSLHYVNYVVLITYTLKTEWYLNSIHKTSFSTTHIAPSTSITQTKIQVTFKEKE
jgi:hypothetical protein